METLIRILLIPLSWLFRFIVSLRRQAYARGYLPSHRLPISLLVIGNIAIGGTGKSPLVIWMVKYLQAQGLKPGVISRGYGGTANTVPQTVQSNADPAQLGDEAVMIARHVDCPIYVCRNRFQAATALLEVHDCNILISDDGLQHYALQRDYEIAVIDGQRRHGNRRCLPAGPLREPIERLQTVDAIVCNGDAGLPGEYRMELQASGFRRLDDDSIVEPDHLRQQPVHAVAGIGNPDRFFASLRAQGFELIEHRFSDHHVYTDADINFDDSLLVLMTEKDAVKCRGFAQNRHYYLLVEAQLSKGFRQHLQQALALFVD